MKKILIAILLIIFTSAYSKAQVFYEELTIPKNPSYRLGTSNEPEQEYKVKNVETLEQQKAKTVREYIKNKSYADSTLFDLSRELAQIIDSDKETIVADIGILWAGAASKSETVKFTIYKLANPDADKPDENIIKRVVRPLAGFASLSGAGLLNPVAATSAIMSGALVNSFSTDDKDLNYKYTKVTDADMIMLLNRVDELQKCLIAKYIDYMTALQASEKANAIVKNRYQNLNSMKNQSRELILVADAYYRSALEKKQSLEFDFLSKRAALEQLVGVEAMAEFETIIKKRHNL